VAEMKEHGIPEIDLVIVDLYPFEETVASTDEEKLIIEKIDIGGPSMIRAAAKNHADVVVIAAKKDYSLLKNLLKEQNGETTLEQRKIFAIKAFDLCTHYDNAISSYFNALEVPTPFNKEKSSLRYGENPHQAASFHGDLREIFIQLHGKELSYNNLVDVDAALQLIEEFKEEKDAVFSIIKHTNVCGAAIRENVSLAWQAALTGDPESAFGGVLVSNTEIDEATANAINEIFFEVLIAPSFNIDALQILQQKKNRILLQVKKYPTQKLQTKSLLNGVLIQQTDDGNFTEWKEVGGRETTVEERASLTFANILCKHLKSNAIALVKNNQLIGKGCGQTSRIDALRNAIDKAKKFGADTTGAALASAAFFPFDDCVRIAHTAGIDAFIQPGGSMRDNDSIEYCKVNNLAMVITGTRHFKH
jgi:phosphoribosylaminoimidazolecarboxamide formyltransferase / IMP cyclohydrolase